MFSFLRYFHCLDPLDGVGLVVSACLLLCLCVPSRCCFLGLSLALRYHDQFPRRSLDGGEVWWGSIVGKYEGEVWWGSMVGKYGGEEYWAVWWGIIGGGMVGKYVGEVWWGSMVGSNYVTM